MTFFVSLRAVWDAEVDFYQCYSLSLSLSLSRSLSLALSLSLSVGTLSGLKVLVHRKCHAFPGKMPSRVKVGCKNALVESMLFLGYRFILFHSVTTHYVLDKWLHNMARKDARPMNNCCKITGAEDGKCLGGFQHLTSYKVVATQQR